MGWVTPIGPRAVSLHCTTSWTGPGSNPGARTVNQTVHPSGVGKLVAISIQWVTAVEYCEGNSATVYDGWRADYAAVGTSVSCTDVLRSSNT
jgi:hypothetical protein